MGCTALFPHSPSPLFQGSDPSFPFLFQGAHAGHRDASGVHPTRSRFAQAQRNAQSGRQLAPQSAGPRRLGKATALRCRLLCEVAGFVRGLDNLECVLEFYFPNSKPRKRLNFLNLPLKALNLLMLIYFPRVNICMYKYGIDDVSKLVSIASKRVNIARVNVPSHHASIVAQASYESARGSRRLVIFCVFYP